ncbi:MAG: hypothetical protein WC831_02095 [Parcubacteria group bacterium]|jgi:hypothetical protein
MTPGKRIIKKTIISAVYVVIFSLLAVGFYSLFSANPTCSDGTKNQNEEGVDCGGSCSAVCEKIPDVENIQVIEKNILPAGDGQYDVLARISNPNTQFGIADLEYSFDLLDGAGKIVGQSEGKNFILPSQEKYILAFNLTSSSEPKDLNFKIRSFRWTKFSEYEEPLVQVYSKEFNFVSAGSNFATLKARIKNLSDYDFRNITVSTIIRNDQNVPVALNQTNVNDVKVNEEREIVFNWGRSFEISQEAPKIEINTDVDFFSDDNFMKKYGSPDQYRSYGADSE